MNFVFVYTCIVKFYMDMFHLHYMMGSFLNSYGHLRLLKKEIGIIVGSTL